MWEPEVEVREGGGGEGRDIFTLCACADVSTTRQHGEGASRRLVNFHDENDNCVWKTSFPPQTKLFPPN